MLLPNMMNYMTQKIEGLLSKNVAKKQWLRKNSLLQSQEPQYQLCKKVSKTKSSLLPQYFDIKVLLFARKVILSTWTKISVKLASWSKILNAFNVSM